MGADEMFEKLGYKKEIDVELIEGSKLTKYYKNYYYISITFCEDIKNNRDNYWSINIMPSRTKKRRIRKNI